MILLQEAIKYFLVRGWMLIVFSLAANAEHPRVSLLTEVSVRTDTLRLSDLLPTDAGLQLRVAAERVSLGRAPQTGSLRVFTADGLRQAIGEAAPFTSEIDVPLQVVVRRWAWPIELEELRRTLARSKLASQLDFSQAGITLPPGLSTAVPDPQFQVTALTPRDGDRSWLARMRCSERKACGSFLAELTVSAPASTGGTRPELLSAAFFPRRLKPISESGPFLVRPGKMAVLVIDGDGFRITQPVMPLRRARLGELVRVSDPLTHRSVVARVSGNGMLRPDTTRKQENK